jgi:acetate kinase
VIGAGAGERAVPNINRKASAAGTELTVLALNSGSSSLKFGLYRVSAAHSEVMLAGDADSIGGKTGTFRARDSRGKESMSTTVPNPSLRGTIQRIDRLLVESKLPAPDAIGHRLVHGGPTLRQHCVIDEAVSRELKAATPFAPLHTPSALAVIYFAHEAFPGLAQAACFDTTFHVELPAVARVLPIPKELRSQGLERYGFHGLSCESIVYQLANDSPHRLPERLIIAHLGNGASITAVKHGKSIDTSMGLTPTGGVIMGTRSGDLDPGLLVYLMREKQFNATQLAELLDHRSGLLGISGVASDMRSLHAAAPSNADARLAIAMFCYAVRKQVAAMSAVLDGLDMLVFSGGIGENDASVRAAICGGLVSIGVSIDDTRNRSGTNPLNDSASRCAVRILAAQEEAQIARHAWALLAAPESDRPT